MSLTTLRLILITTTLAFATPAQTQNQPLGTIPATATQETPEADQSNAALPDDPELRTGKLPNGLTYYIRKNRKPGNHVEMRLAIKAGSILEDDDQRGLAHFVEHMMFGGTRHFPPHTLVSRLESLGVKFGADLNAFTNTDDTIYILPLPLDKPENLETGMQILEDWAQGALFTDAGVEQERPVVLEELRGSKGAIERMTNVAYAEQFEGSRYALRRPIGLESVLTHFKPAVARRFYHDWYRPDLEAVIVVGDIDPDQVQRMITDHFSSLTNPPKERPRATWPVPPRKKTTGLVITDSESPYNLVTIRYPTRPALPEASAADFREFLVRRLAAAMIEQRLFEMTQVADPPFIDASFSVEQSAPGVETAVISTVIGHRGIAPALAALSNIGNAVRRDGFSPDELNRSKLNLQHYYDDLYAERYGTNSKTLAEMYRRHFLFHESTMDVGYRCGLASELLPDITMQDVNSLARKTIPADAPRLITYMGASGENLPLPDGKKLVAMLKDADNAPIASQQDDLPSRPLPTALMQHPPKGGTIVSRRTHEQLGLTEFTLSNGVKVLFKPTYLQREQVLLSAARFGGQSLYPDTDKFNATYASAIQSAMGVADFTPAEIRKIIAGKSIQLQTSINLFGESITGSTDNADLESLLQWLYLSMTAPRRDEQLFQSFIGRYKDFAKNTMLRPESVFQDKIIEALSDHHPRAQRPAHPEDFDRINLDRAMGIYHDRLGSADGLTFIITGGFNIDAITPLITTYLGALPTTKIDQHYRDLGMRTTAGKIELNVKAGTQDKSQVVMMFNGPTKYSLREANEFFAAVDIIKQRITHVLREQLSLTYNGTIAGSMERTPYQNYSIAAALPCAPENTLHVIAALTTEIENLKRDGPKQEELDSVKQIWLKSREVEKTTNQFWSSYLQDDLLYDTNPNSVLTFESRIKTITIDQVRNAARRYFDFDNIIQAVLYPADRISAPGVAITH